MLSKAAKTPNELNQEYQNNSTINDYKQNNKDEGKERTIEGQMLKKNMQSQSQILNNEESINSLPRDAQVYSSSKGEKIQKHEVKNTRVPSQNIIVASVGIEGGIKSTRVTNFSHICSVVLNNHNF